MRYLLALLVILVLALGGFWVYAGRGGAPVITIDKPKTLVGQAGILDVVITTPGGKLSELNATLEQGGQSVSLFSLAQPGGATSSRKVRRPCDLRVASATPTFHN